jgi:outer membrane lipoprotein-sorting protein
VAVFKAWRKMIWVLVLLLVLPTAAPVYGELNLAQIKERVLETLNKGNYTVQYTETSFRFGRRQESASQVWVKERSLLRRMESPFWQRGEVTLENDNRFLFFIPNLNVGLKLDHQSGKNKKPLPEWKNWLDKVTQFDGETVLTGRPVFSLSGVSDKNSFRIYIDKEYNFPIGFDLNRRGILIQSLRFQQFKKLPASFNLESFFPENVKWYENETKFWQAISIPRVQMGVNFPIGQPAYVPEGYQFLRASIEELSQATVVHLLYENSNRQRISIFEREKLSDRQRFSFEEFIRAGQTVYVYQFFSNQVNYAIIGAVPVEELKKIAASIK